jgi:hypothetical protein
MSVERIARASGADTRFLYRANGLTFDSQIALPELAPGTGAPDVVIRYGHVPDRVDEPLATGPWYQAARGCFLLRVPRVAGYWAVDGRSVTVAPDEQATDDEVRVFLIASVLGAIAHQKGFLPLHASAVQIGDGCVLLAGPSGAGKSTLAAAFAQSGFPLVAEDLCAISLDTTGDPVVHPGYRHIKLWADALDHFGAGFSGGRHVRPGLQKFSIPLSGASSGNVGSVPLPIRRIYLLGTGVSGPITLEPIHGESKLALLRRQTYRRRLTAGCGDPIRHFTLTHALAERVELVSVRRPWSLSRLADVVRCIEDDVASPARA